MFKRTVTENDQTVVTNDRTAATATIGYACIGITFWMLGMIMADWFPMGNMDLELGLMYGLGGILLVIVGVLTMIYGRSLDTIIFLGVSGLFFCMSVALFFSGFHTGRLSVLSGAGQINLSVPGANNPAGLGIMTMYFGWFALCWAVFFCYLWIASFRAGAARMLFLLLFWLGALAMAIGGWTGSYGFEVLSGYLIMISAILAFLVSAIEIISFEPGKFFRKKVISQNQVTIEDSNIPDERRPGMEA